VGPKTIKALFGCEIPEGRPFCVRGHENRRPVQVKITGVVNIKSPRCRRLNRDSITHILRTGFQTLCRRSVGGDATTFICSYLGLQVLVATGDTLGLRCAEKNSIRVP